MKLKKLFLIICTICFTVALSCGIAACGDDKDEVIRVSDVSLNKNELTLEVGKEETLTAIVNPSNATDQTVEWYSDDPAVATVDENGVVKGVAIGETTITVSASRKQATCKVTVTASTAVGVSSVTLNHQAIVMLVGETNTNLVPTVLPANSATVSWSSSNTDSVKVNDKGHLTAVAVGTSTITATAGGKSATCQVTVVEEKVVEGIEITPEELELEVGAKGTLKTTVYPLGLDANIVWASSKSDIATVDNGAVTAVAVGETVITATAGEKSATCTVTVKAKASDTVVAVESVTLDHTTLTVNVDDTEKLTATVAPSNATNKNVTWKSSNEDIATVDGNGNVKGLKVGDTVITVTTVDGNKSATCNVTVVATIDDKSIVTYAHAGEESAAFEWKDNDASKAKVEYKLSSASSFTKIDSQLVRQKSSTLARADIVGLKGGEKYDFKITSSNNTVVKVENVDIASLDRSGYAHYRYEDGVGAYNDDGTLKSNATVIYLTESNKNNVDGSGKSIAQYLAAAANNSKPIVVRVIGTVGSATWNQVTYNKTGTALTDYLKTILPTDHKDITQAELIAGNYNTLNYYPDKLNGQQCDPINGLNSKATYKDGEYDSMWNDCSVQYVKNLTVEGIGEDAEIFQWGFTFKNCNSIEVRNIRFYDYTEDACSFEGDQEHESSADGFTYKHFWIHHNIFDIGMNYWDVCPEQDKGDGDGATDFKKLSYVTIAYNRYNGTHKTGLVGGDDAHLQASFTFHHNYYNGCDQRMPLGRQANMHLYNNYYSSSGLYSVSLRARAYAFIENCVFTSNPAKNTKPIELKDDKNLGRPSVKVVNCQMEGSISNSFGSQYVYQGDDRDATVSGTNRYGQNFDTSSDFKTYYKVTSKLATNQVATTIPNIAGTLKHVSNIKIDGSSQDDSGNTGDNTGGGDNPGGNTNPPVSFGSTVTKSVSIDVADLITDGILAINKESHSINKAIADGIVINTANGKVTDHSKTIGGVDLTHRIVLKGTGNNYIAITTGGACTIKVYVANGSTSDGKRVIGLYTDTAAGHSVGSTAELDKGETALLECNVTTAGTYYLESITNELGIYRIDIEVSDSGGATPPTTGTTYTYVYGGTKSDGFTVPTSTATADDKVTVGTKISADTTATLTASGTKISISMKGFTTGSSSASEWAKITLKASDGTVVGTIKGTTPASKAVGNFTFTNSGELVATAQFATVEITFEGTEGKNFCITELIIIVY